MSDRGVRFVLKPIVFVASLGPFFYLVWAACTGNLSANPLADLFCTGARRRLLPLWDQIASDAGLEQAVALSTEVLSRVARS